jgi:hypothetical protein
MLSSSASMRIASLTLAILLCGCFGDSTPVGGTGDTGSSTGDTCPPGGAGCPCYPNDTCDEGFTCVVEAGTCVTDDCTPGEIGCTCVDGQCLGEAVCDAGVCNPPGGGSASGGSTGSASTTTSVDETSAGSSDATDATSAGTSADDATSMNETGKLPSCGQCFDEATVGDGVCGDEADSCNLDPICTMAYDCVEDCVHSMATDTCIDGCCDIAGAENVPYLNFAMCMLSACGDPICPTPAC